MHGCLNGMVVKARSHGVLAGRILVADLEIVSVVGSPLLEIRSGSHI